MALEIGEYAASDRRAAVLRAHLHAPGQSANPKKPAHPNLCPEIDCLRSWLSADTVAAAERRALNVGTGADRVLINAGSVDEEIYVRLLADSLNIPFESLDALPREVCPVPDDQLPQSFANDVLPVLIQDELKFLLAPRGLLARTIVQRVRAEPGLAKRLRLTTTARMQDFATRHAAEAVGRQASRALATNWPSLSAGPPRWRRSLIPALLVCAVGFAAFLVFPGPATRLCDLCLTTFFLAWMALRVAGILLAPRSPPPLPRPRMPDHNLPIYTVLAPLYREAAAIPGLIAALQLLDYPREKLDIKLVVEADDRETRDALARLSLAPPFEIIVVPQSSPRTKPKALNYALPFARGAYTVIYDAEDRPEPRQLRDALDVFLAHDKRVACVQASLTIDNTADNWLAATFTAEYAGQFDVFLPALAKLGLPLPLGGSSNHFRTATLHAVGAWDPYNVTEDADLGLRLVRFGYRSVSIDSATFEEAPGKVLPWLRQRTRWFKGWMQTWLVHMRQPRKLIGDLGLPAFLATQLIVGGNVLASLVHPALLVWLVTAAFANAPLWEDGLVAALFTTAMVSGYLASVALGITGLIRRGLAAYAWVLVLVPVHWLMLSIAAWRALYQIICDPYRWEKTEHGLARTSRLQLAPATEAVFRAVPKLSFRKRPIANARQQTKLQPNFATLTPA